MIPTLINQSPYLRTSREFPEEMHGFAREVNKAYIETANAVNLRAIGLFPTSRAIVTGEAWYLTSNQKQQSLRQVFTFTNTTTFNHNLKIIAGQVPRAFGSFTDSTNTYGLIYGSNIAIAGQIGFYITPTQIVFTVGASAPALQSGLIVIEPLSSV